MLTFAGVVLADKLPPTERKNTSPSMAKFYKVDGSGESKADTVTVPTLSRPEPEVSPEVSSEVSPEVNNQPPVKQARPERARPKKRSDSRRIEVVVKKKPPRYDSREAWRCERAGFYYTSDGRCVAPAGNARRINPGGR